MDFFFCAVLAVVFSFLPTPAVMPQALSLPVPFSREASEGGGDAAEKGNRNVRRRDVLAVGLVRDDNGRPVNFQSATAR